MESNRYNPLFWDHQWHVLVNLRKVIEKVFKDSIKLDIGTRVVDFGCGDKPYEGIFRKSKCEYITCDLNGDVDFIISPGKEVSIDSDSVDGIVSFQVLEHVWELDWYLGSCYRILKKNGWLVLSTHGDWLYHPHPNDYRRWTREGLIKELQEKGFTVKEVYPIVGPLALTTQFRLLGIYYVLRSLPVLGFVLFLPIACLMNFIMIIEDLITPRHVKDNNACIYLVVSFKK